MWGEGGGVARGQLRMGSKLANGAQSGFWRLDIHFESFKEQLMLHLSTVRKQVITFLSFVSFIKNAER